MSEIPFYKGYERMLKYLKNEYKIISEEIKSLKNQISESDKYDILSPASITRIKRIILALKLKKRELFCAIRVSDKILEEYKSLKRIIWFLRSSNKIEFETIKGK